MRLSSVAIRIFVVGGLDVPLFQRLVMACNLTACTNTARGSQDLRQWRAPPYEGRELESDS